MMRGVLRPLLRRATGVSHLLERLAFKATHNRTAFRVTREVRPTA